MMKVMERGSGMTVIKQTKQKKICICMMMIMMTLMMMMMQMIEYLRILMYLSTLHVKQLVVTLIILYD